MRASSASRVAPSAPPSRITSTPLNSVAVFYRLRKFKEAKPNVGQGRYSSRKAGIEANELDRRYSSCGKRTAG